MLWIRNADKIAAGSPFNLAEYEVASERPIGGALHYRDGTIRCTSLSPRLQDGLIRSIVAVNLAEFTAPLEPTRTATRKGYLFREGLIGELLTLFSLHFQARFFLLSSTIRLRGDYPLKTYQPFTYHPPQSRHDPVVFPRRSSSSHWNDPALKGLLDRLGTIDARHHQSLILAIYNYARALREIGVDEDMVFVRLVSSVEALSKDVDVSDKDALAGKEFEELICADLSTEVRESLRNSFEHRKTKERFVRFLEMYSTGYFRGGRRKAQSTWIPKKQLRRTAETIYSARSEYLHAGAPMLHSLKLGEYWHNWDMDPSVGTIEGDRRWKSSAKLPYPHWFHQLVRHCLLRYIDKIAPDDEPEGERR